MLHHWARSFPARGVFASVAVVALIAGCGSESGGDTGHLTGTVYTMGGKEAERQPAEAEVTATLVGDDAGPTHTAHTDGDAQFTMDLPAGTYEISGTLSTGIPGGQITPQEVTITAGGDVSIELFSIYP